MNRFSSSLASISSLPFNAVSNSLLADLNQAVSDCSIIMGAESCVRIYISAHKTQNFDIFYLILS